MKIVLWLVAVAALLVVVANGVTLSFMMDYMDAIDKGMTAVLNAVEAR